MALHLLLAHARIAVVSGEPMLDNIKLRYSNVHVYIYCPFYDVPMHGNWRGMSRRMQDFCATKLSCSVAQERGRCVKMFLNVDCILYISWSDTALPKCIATGMPM